MDSRSRILIAADHILVAELCKRLLETELDVPEWSATVEPPSAWLADRGAQASRSLDRSSPEAVDQPGHPPAKRRSWGCVVLPCHS
jgi:hypothetical protein